MKIEFNLQMLIAETDHRIRSIESDRAVQTKDQLKALKLISAHLKWMYDDYGITLCSPFLTKNQFLNDLDDFKESYIKKFDNIRENWKMHICFNSCYDVDDVYMMEINLLSIYREVINEVTLMIDYVTTHDDYDIEED